MLAYPPFIFFHLYYSRPLFSFFAYATLYRNTIILYLTKKLRDSRTPGVRDSRTLGFYLFFFLAHSFMNLWILTCITKDAIFFIKWSMTWEFIKNHLFLRYTFSIPQFFSKLSKNINIIKTQFFFIKLSMTLKVIKDHIYAKIILAHSFMDRF